MNTIYRLTHPWDFTLDDFATNDEELQWLAINYCREYYGLEVLRAEIDWEAGTVTTIPLHGNVEAFTFQIHKINRATQEDAQ
jgi:hypothetical protein